MARTNTGSASNYFSSTLSYQSDVSNVRTYCFRFKTSSDTDQYVISNRDSSNRGWSVGRGAANDTLQIVIAGVAAYNSTASAIPADGNWHHCIITSNAGALAFYVDTATAKGTATYGSYTNSTANVVVGALGGSPVSSPLNGSLADVAIFSGTILNATDIANFMAGSAPNTLTSAGATLDHYWKLDNSAAGNESATTGGVTLTENGTMGYEAATFGSSSQILLPSADITTTGWTSSAGGALYAAIDESAASDSDYIYTGTLDAECEVQLQSGSTPGAGLVND